MFDTFEAMFGHIEKDIKNTTLDISQMIQDLWKDLVKENFYNAYSPIEYVRTFEVLNSIDIINIVETQNKISVTIGYNTGLINKSTYIGKSSGLERVRHQVPDNMPELIEFGFDGFGVHREGAGAFEYLSDYLNSNQFVVDFKNEMLKKGYHFR